MKKSFLLVLCGLLVGAGSAWSFQKAAKHSHYTDETYGFSLDTPDFARDPATVNVVPALFAAPGVNGFSSNVNIAVQRTKTTKDAYRELSLGQFKQVDLKVNSDRSLKVSGRDAVEFDYQGKVQNRELRFLSLAVIDTGRVLLVTCTATSEGFAAVEDEFRACLASIRLTGESL